MCSPDLILNFISPEIGENIDRVGWARWKLGELSAIRGAILDNMSQCVVASNNFQFYHQL